MTNKLDNELRDEVCKLYTKPYSEMSIEMKSRVNEITKVASLVITKDRQRLLDEIMAASIKVVDVDAWNTRGQDVFEAVPTTHIQNVMSKDK